MKMEALPHIFMKLTQATHQPLKSLPHPQLKVELKLTSRKVTQMDIPPSLTTTSKPHLVLTTPRELPPLMMELPT